MKYKVQYSKEFTPRRAEAKNCFFCQKNPLFWRDKKEHNFCILYLHRKLSINFDFLLIKELIK